jgi:predicted transcriptional regulator
MKIDTSEKWLPVYEALGSDVRLKIIGFLAKRPMNVKELAGALHLSSAIVTMHVRKLEKAQIIRCERTSTAKAIQKLCSLAVDTIEIQLPNHQAAARQFHEFSIPVGHYTDINVTPTCGLATSEKIIGHFDDPRYFLDPERVHAQILWFTEGFIEYRIPNYLLSDQEPEELEISLELGSEAPGVNSVWPSDISFFLNGVPIGMWTSPGDFGEKRGKYTPEWWSLSVGQYGLFKVIRINGEGSFIDGLKISDVTLHTLDIKNRYLNFRIAVLPDSEHIGGVSLFGRGFGNYNQDIVFKLYYR